MKFECLQQTGDLYACIIHTELLKYAQLNKNCTIPVLVYLFQRGSYGGPYVQYTKENISAQTRVEIHKQNIQYTIRSIGSRKYVSVHDKFGKYTTTYLTTSE